MLTEEQAYQAMVRFLEQYYEIGKEEAIHDLVSAVACDVWADRMPNDPAMWPMWLESVQQILKEKPKA